MKKISLFIISLIIFSFGIYIFRNFFLGTSELELNNHIEDTYIEPVIITEDLNSGSEFIKKSNIQSNITNDIEKRVSFSYFPVNLNSEISDYTNSFKSFLYSFLISDKIDLLKVEIHQDKPGIRGNMKNHSIKLFGIKQMSTTESTAVGIHEFGHFVDLYYFKKHVINDISDYFYNISWDSAKVIKSGQKIDDFVSGYSMTNKYEDFAECFIYFVLHNADFKEKATKSQFLKKKYDFFDTYLFRGHEFDKSDFSAGEIIKPYYRDITKINFSLNNFLEFLKK